MAQFVMDKFNNKNLNMQLLIETLTDELGEDLPVVQKKNNLWEINPEDRLTIQIIELDDPSCMVLRSDLGAASIQEDILQKLLVANLNGDVTANSSLGIDESGKRVQLVKALKKEIVYEDFRDILEAFVNSALFWQETVASWINKKN